MQLCEIEYSIGAIFKQLHDYSTSIPHLVTALKIAEMHHDKTNSYMVAGELISHYLEAATPSKAFGVLDTLKKKYPGENNNHQLVELNLGYVYTYMALKQFHEAQPNVDQLLKLASLPGTPGILFCKIYRVLIGFYIADGRYNEANFCLARYRDSALKYPYTRELSLAYRFAYQID